MKRKTPPSPPRLPEVDALAAYCHDCFANPGDPCRNYKGQAKPPCRTRGHTMPVRPAMHDVPRSLFETPAEEPEAPQAETPDIAPEIK